MLNRKLLVIASLTVGLGMSASGPARAEGVDADAVLANACATCHGTDGRGAQKMPDLQDLELDDFVETMKGFQTGKERATVMDRIAKDLTADEINRLAKHFVKLKSK